MMPPSDRYEFDSQQDQMFARLASAMAFIGIGMLVPGILLSIAAVVFRATLLGAGICAVFAILLIAMGLLQYQAAGHFRRIVNTTGSDVDNLMIALGELTSVYEIQRWLWIVLAAAVLIALAAGTVAGSG